MLRATFELEGERADRRHLGPGRQKAADYHAPHLVRHLLAQGQDEALGEPYSTVSLTSMLLRVALE